MIYQSERRRASKSDAFLIDMGGIAAVGPGSAPVYFMQLRAILFMNAALLCTIAAQPGPVLPPDPPPPYEPKMIVSVGPGVEGLGPAQIFGFASVSQRVAAKTYTTQIYEAIRMPGGTVGTSARAGLTTVLYELGRIWIGLVGDVGVAEGPTGSANGAFSGSGFVHCRCFGSLPMGVVVTAQTLKVAGSDGSKARFRIGFTWSF